MFGIRRRRLWQQVKPIFHSFHDLWTFATAPWSAPCGASPRAPNVLYPLSSPTESAPCFTIQPRTLHGPPCLGIQSRPGEVSTLLFGCCPIRLICSSHHQHPPQPDPVKQICSRRGSRLPPMASAPPTPAHPDTQISQTFMASSSQLLLASPVSPCTPV